MHSGGDTRWSTRVVLALGVLSGLVYVALVPILRPDQLGIASDVYYHAANAMLSGGDIYATSPPDHPRYLYLYPPVVTVLFLPHGLVGGETAAHLLQNLLNLGTVLALVYVLARALERHGTALTRRDHALLGTFVLLSIHSSPQFVMGQVTLQIALAVAVALDALDRGFERRAGVAVTAGAAIKLFPAILGVWFLRRRHWRAVTAAIVAAVTLFVAGLLLFGPDTTGTYLFDVLPGQFQDEAFAGTPNPARNFSTARRQITALVPGLPAALLSPVTFALLAPPVAVLYRRTDTTRRRLTAVLGTLVATLLFLPLEPLYLSIAYYPLVLLLFCLPTGWPRRLLVGGLLWTYAVVSMATVRGFLSVADLSAATEARVIEAAATVFTVIQPPTVGLWLLLSACVLYHVTGGGDQPTVAGPSAE